MLNRIVRIIGGDPTKKAIAEYSPLVDAINQLEFTIEGYSDEALRAKSDEFRRRLVRGETLDDLLIEAFAIVREASKRTIGLRHYDVQMIGGAVLHQGRIAEMKTGEGKTLVATLPLYLNALALNPAWMDAAQERWGSDPENWVFEPIGDLLVGLGTHLITVNDYLARRDARWKAPIYELLGLKVGVLQMAARTENGKKAFLVDREIESPHEDQDQLRMVPRQLAYQADIVYGTNSEFGFDYLRDNMAMRLEDRVQRGHYYAIIDEVDNVLIDEARTPLIISGPSHDDTEWYLKMAQVVRQLGPETYEVSEKDRTVVLTEYGETQVERLLGMALRDPERPEDITPEQARILGYLEQAMRAQHLFKRNKDYLVQAGKVVIVDEFTGRLMPGRRWSDGLHQAVEAKEGVKVQRENVTYATITIQNYFRMYTKLAGMTGTALTEAEEFSKIYDLEVVAIPTNLEYQASRPETDLVELEARDADGYKFIYYAREGDDQETPLFWKRQDFPDVVYRTEEAKMRAIVKGIMYNHVKGRPLLVGTTSVELSERLSGRLKAEPVRKLGQVLLLRASWFERNNYPEDGRQVAELVFLNEPLERLNAAELRRMARDLDISFNFKARENLDILLRALRLGPEDAERLENVLQGGVPHQVLNARKHTEESQIIAGAGAFGAVTIATNMAGRGVDIKLGGELPEEVVTNVNRVLRRAGNEDPYDMTMEDRRTALEQVDPAEYGVFEPDVLRFLEYIRDMEKVRVLGGLHVIGSERHDSRRIDNQLRGRAARQGDPGSSRFYLSMEDELMRLFGGEQANDWMQRLNVDEALPLEHGMVGRIIEQAQTRVEGANFDARKHLLEYDDVLNTQRASIYTQRDRIFVKEDLSEDVNEMLDTEILERVPQALEDAEGPWRLLAWLEQIQPAMTFDDQVYPSFTLRVLVDSLNGNSTFDRKQAFDSLINIAEESILAEEEHLLRAVDQILINTRARLELDLEERMDAFDIFFEGLELEDEFEDEIPSDLLGELSNLVRVPVKLSRKEAQELEEDPEAVRDTIEEQIESFLQMQAIIRLLGAVERRLESDFSLEPNDLLGLDWDALTDRVIDVIEEIYATRRQRLIGDRKDGAIARDLETALESYPEPIARSDIYRLLLIMPRGARATFDRKTHRRVWERTTRLTYVQYTAQLLDNRDPDELVSDILAHLQGARLAIQYAWGRSELRRLAGVKPVDLTPIARRGLENALGETAFEQIGEVPLTEVPADLHETTINEMGRQAITEVYRQLLLGVISELWVEYLTQMEALRVSIGLEAYAQRDPLVQYKSKAFEMYRKLLSDMRIGVVSRMFTFRPRNLDVVQTEVPQPAQPQPVQEVAAEKEIGSSSKRRRRRRKKRK